MTDSLFPNCGKVNAPASAADNMWRAPTAASWELAPDVIHLWRFALDVSQAELGALAALLGDDEPERAARRIFERDRQHFIAARGTLRLLLGRYLQRDPASLSFCYGPHGKPALHDATLPPGCVQFNLAHSHGMALLAVSLDRAVGVDLERMRDQVRCDALAARSFSPAELQRYQAQRADLRRWHFFHAWAVKESLLKATGRGMSLPMHEVEVADKEQAAGLLQLTDERGELKSWHWQSIEIGADFAAAVAAEEGYQRVCHWQWCGS